MTRRSESEHLAFLSIGFDIGNGVLPVVVFDRGGMIDLRPMIGRRPLTKTFEDLPPVPLTGIVARFISVAVN